MSLAGATHAFWVRDFVEATSTPSATANRVVTAVAALLLLFWGARALETLGAAPVQGGFFAWAVVGWAALQLSRTALNRFSDRLRQHRALGLFEACVLSRTPPWQLVLAMPSFNLLGAAVFTAVFGLGGLWAGGLFPSVGQLSEAALHAALGTACFATIGVLSAAATLVLRVADPIGRAVYLAGLVFSGVFVPRDLLPEPMRLLGAALPMAPMLDGIRGALFEEGFDATRTLTQLIVTLALLAPVAAAALAAAFRHVQRGGLLGPE